MRNNLLFLLIVLLTTSLNAELVHRYEFNGNTEDSVGSADAEFILNGGSSYYLSGSLLLGNSSLPLSNGEVNYIDLPNGIISSLGSAATIEIWFYWNGPGDNTSQMILNFGSNDTGEDTSTTGFYSDFIFLSVSRLTLRNSIRHGGESLPNHIYLNSSIPTNQLTHAAFVWDDTTGQVTLYLNGISQGSTETRFTLPELKDVDNWIGRSGWMIPPAFNGRISEFRVHNNPFTPEMIMASKEAGPEDIVVPQYTVPTNPSPAHKSASWLVPSALQWQPDGNSDIVQQNIYLGTDYMQVVRADTSSEVFKGSYSGETNSYVLDDDEISSSNTYFWRIESVTSTGYKFSSPIWSFNQMKRPEACTPGDLSGDCVVDIADLAEFSLQWLSEVDCEGFDCADLDGNQYVDLFDFVSLSNQWQENSKPMIVINEIDYHPESNTDPLEFIELYHAGAQPIDLKDWEIAGGISYEFTESTIINPGEYLVISQNPDAIMAKYGVSSYGPFEGKLSNKGEEIELRNEDGKKIDTVDYRGEFPWPTAANGDGASMELINPTLDNNLSGSWRSSGHRFDLPEFAFTGPTPGKINNSFAINAPPQIRQVDHNPKQPESTETTTITAKITDPDGVGSVTLKYQIVSPGNYIPAYLPIEINDLYSDPIERHPINPEFENPANWTSISMVDDGSGADLVAGDDVYTAEIPVQINRTLVRYRIVTSDNTGQEVRVPYFDDESLNFAFYVYDGVPDYVTTDTSVSGQAGYTYGSDIMTSIPVYSLITRSEDLTMCYGYSSSDRINQDTTDFANQETGRRYNWEGAFVYEGVVYDHIGYRLRGGNGRYNYGLGGKRSMKFRFNRGNFFQARDIYGNKFPAKWRNLNTGKMFGNQITFAGYRSYPYGLNEVMDMRLFQQVGSPAPETWWIHFRVVDGVEEAPLDSNGQYSGDFFGLHLAFENYDGDFLDRLGLPKGNVYKLSDKVFDGLEQLRYQGPDSVTEAQDYTNIRFNLNHTASADFIRTYLDCDQWYRYHTITEAIRHYDIFSGADCWHCLKNSAWYFLPAFTESNPYGQLWFLPFDVDDTWGSYFNQGVDHAKAAIYDQRYENSLEQFTQQPEKSPLKQEYRNFIREYRDLHWQPEVINGMIDELAAVIESFVPADRDRWRQDYSSGSPIDNGTLEDRVDLMKQFAWEPGYFQGSFYWVGSNANLDQLANAEGDAGAIPYTPTVTYTGNDGYPENDLKFTVSNFSDPQGNDSFAAMKWRIAEYDLDFNTSNVNNTAEYTVIEKESNWKYFKGQSEPSNPIYLWRYPDYDDSNWSNGQTVIGYGDGNANTSLDDMYRSYRTVYIRKEFEIDNPDNIVDMTLNVLIDDGCIIWINGNEVARLYCSWGDKYYNSLTNRTTHDVSNGFPYDQVVIENASSLLVPGTNVIAIHGLQSSINSSDFSLDAELIASTKLPVTMFNPSENVKYEINPLYETDEITTFDSNYQFPAEGVKPGRTYRVRCKMKDNTGRWSHWSAPVEFIAGEAIGSDIKNHFRLTELMYNQEDADFIEFKNTSFTDTLDLSTVSIRGGIDFDFSGSNVQSLAPGEFVLVVKKTEDFEDIYGTSLRSRVAGEFDGKLSNGGEDIKIEDFWNGSLIEFEYNDGRGWPIAADGSGHSLVPIESAIEDQPSGTLDYGGNWRASSYLGGSPGADDPTAPASSVVINEFMAHTDLSDPAYPDYDSNDWIELFNAGGSSVTLGDNWYLSDDIDNLKKWELPTSTVSSGGFISFDELTGFHNPITSGFGLDKAGEKIYLSYLPGVLGVDRIVDAITFAGQDNNVSLGRYPDGGDFWFSFNNGGTKGSSNIEPVEHVIISEIMYHPADGLTNSEYIEIYNPTDSTIQLWTEVGSWQFEGGIDFILPAGVTISSGQSIIFVAFDPTNSQILDDFMETYSVSGLVANQNVFGPWSGTLSSNTDRLTLCKPQASDDPMDPDALSLITIDQCNYNDYWPWPEEPDGFGEALGRVNYLTTISSDDPTSWTAVQATPGY